MERSGSWFRGRAPKWDSDAQAIEQERQKWVYEKVTDMNEMIRDLAVDPALEYQLHRLAWEETGDLTQLMLMLEYVQP